MTYETINYIVDLLDKNVQEKEKERNAIANEIHELAKKLEAQAEYGIWASDQHKKAEDMDNKLNEADKRLHLDARIKWMRDKE